FGHSRGQGASKPADGLRKAARVAMGFGQNDGTLEKAKQRVGQFAGGRRLLAGALSRDEGLELLREVVRDRLEHARHGLLHAGIRVGKLQRKGPQQAASAPKLRSALFQMLQEGKG